jgi:hypothetical protein
MASLLAEQQVEIAHFVLISNLQVQPRTASATLRPWRLTHIVR